MGDLVLDITGSNPAHKGARALLGHPDVAEVINAPLFMWACSTIRCSHHVKGWFAGSTKAEETWLSGCTMPRGNLLQWWNQVSSQGLWESAGFCFIQTLLVTGQGKVTELQIEISVPLINGKCKKNNFSSSLTPEFSEFLHRLHYSLMFLCNFIKRNRKAYPLTLIFEVYWTIRIHQRHVQGSKICLLNLLKDPWWCFLLFC